MFVSPSAQAIIRGTIVVDPEKRLSIKEILQHPWLMDVPDPPPRPEAGPVREAPDLTVSRLGRGLPIVAGSAAIGGSLSQTKPNIRKLIALGKGRMKVSRASNVVAPVFTPLCQSGGGLVLHPQPSRASNE
jgi:serine/threonine protein kinase